MCVGKLKASNLKLFCKAVAKPRGKGFLFAIFSGEKCIFLGV